MSEYIQKLRTRLVAKLTGLNIIICLLVIGIVSVAAGSFIKVKASITSLINEEVAQMLNNASVERDLSTVFADANLLVATFTEVDTVLASEGERLTGLLQKSLADINTGESKLIQPLKDFSQAFTHLLAQCGVIQENQRTIQSYAAQFKNLLGELDQLVGERLLEGNRMEQAALDSLGVMIPSYHQRLLQSTLQIKAMTQAHLNVKEVQQPYAQEIKALLDALLADLHLINSTGRAFTPLGEKFLEALQQYRQSIMTFAQELQVLQEDLRTLDASEAQVRQAMISMSKELEGASKKLQQQVDDSMRATLTLILSLSVGLILVLILVSIYGVSMFRPLRNLALTADRLADGDLTETIETSRSRDEIGQLSNAMKRMLETLQNVVYQVKLSANNVATGSQELSNSSQVISEGVSEQGASAEEVSASMEQMAANIRQNAENASTTQKISQKAAEDAFESGKAVNETVEAMKGIVENIAIIEEIARQTDLLALNAAIEAARAGDYGRGFAVVASEVRKLAKKSQSAAGEINKLSSSSVSVAEKAGEMINQLVPDIQKTAQLVEEIAAASNDQDTGAEQINRSVQQLDMIIQQNASLSEEVAATANGLARQSVQLKEVVGYFETDESLIDDDPGNDTDISETQEE